MANPSTPGQQYRHRPRPANPERGLQARIGLFVLGCIVAAFDLVQRLRVVLGLEPVTLYRLTNRGRRAAGLPQRWQEISLDDWARLPECGACGQPTALGLPHVNCVADMVAGAV